MARKIVEREGNLFDWDGKKIDNSRLQLITTFDSFGWAELERQINAESHGADYYQLPLLPQSAKVYAYRLKKSTN